MFESYHQAVGAAQASAVWALWSNPEQWPSWNADVISADLEGSFADGGVVRMSVSTGDVVVLTLVDVQPGRGFVDEAAMEGIVVRTEHRVEPDEAGQVRVSYRLTVSGDAPDDVLAEVG